MKQIFLLLMTLTLCSGLPLSAIEQSVDLSGTWILDRSSEKTVGVDGRSIPTLAGTWNGSTDQLLHLLELERIEDNIFRGDSRDIGSPQVFGGQVVGQALSAAQHTVEGRVAKPEKKAPVVHVTASALSIRVPRAGQSLRFEQRLIPENTPMTVELRYKTARRSSDGRNR